MHPHTLKTDRA